MTYWVNNGIPNQITETINQFDQQQHVRYAAFYAQEQWTMGRMTLQGALRFDRAWSYFPAVTVSDKGSLQRADWIVSNAIVRQSLGRDLSNAAPNVTVNIVEPGTL